MKCLPNSDSSLEEVRQTIFSMDPNRASPDGFPGSFGDNVGADVFNFVKNFFYSLPLLPNINANFIILILKESGAN